MQWDRPYRPMSLAIGALSWGLGASSQVPSLPALEKALASSPHPSGFPDMAARLGVSLVFHGNHSRFWFAPGVGWEHFLMLLEVLLE